MAHENAFAYSHLVDPGTYRGGHTLPYSATQLRKVTLNVFSDSPYHL